MDPVLLDQRGIPGADADIVIRHPLTMNLNSVYRHSGNITIETEGILEIIGLGGESRFVYEGTRFANQGILMTNRPVEIRNSSAIGITTFALEAGAQTLLGSDLLLSGHVTLHILNGSCGATIVKGELLVEGERTAVLGKGSWIAEGGFRIWDKNGLEIIEFPQKNVAFTAQMSKGLQLFNEINTCALDQRGLEGTFDPAAITKTDSKTHHQLGLYPNPQVSGVPVHLDGEGFDSQEIVMIEIRTLMGQRVHTEMQPADDAGKVLLQADWNINPGQYIVSIRGSHHYASQRMVRQ